LHFQYDRRFFPHFFQSIEFPLTEREDVNHNVDVIHQYPARVGVAFDAARLAFILLVSVFGDAVDDGFELPLTRAGAYDEVIDVRR
jgi:hypothetical protein